MGERAWAAPMTMDEYFWPAKTNNELVYPNNLGACRIQSDVEREGESKEGAKRGDYSRRGRGEGGILQQEGNT